MRSCAEWARLTCSCAAFRRSWQRCWRPRASSTRPLSAPSSSLTSLAVAPRPPTDLASHGRSPGTWWRNRSASASSRRTSTSWPRSKRPCRACGTGMPQRRWMRLVVSSLSSTRSPTDQPIRATAHTSPSSRVSPRTWSRRHGRRPPSWRRAAAVVRHSRGPLSAPAPRARALQRAMMRIRWTISWRRPVPPPSRSGRCRACRSSGASWPRAQVPLLEGDLGTAHARTLVRLSLARDAGVSDRLWPRGAASSTSEPFHGRVGHGMHTLLHAFSG
mmetsp:Transcript_24851/g.82809  ORF Transcript_24851/g.82809 Transcript_24851/m.82809 type:complete len:274 (-) Transcript_24851:147-968(-)